MIEINPHHRKKKLSLMRGRCDELLRALICRARQVNDYGQFSYIVERLSVFGSYLSDKNRPGDLDVAFLLRPRFGLRSKKQQDADTLRIRARKTRPRDMVDECAWPQIEVMRFLKARSTGISLHEEWELDGLRKKDPTTRFQVVFRNSDPLPAQGKSKSVRQGD